MTWLMIAALALTVGLHDLPHRPVGARDFLFWQQHTDEPIQPWMSIGFVAHSYHVPPPVLHDALGLPPAPDHRPLERIAATKGIAYTVMRDRLYRRDRPVASRRIRRRDRQGHRSRPIGPKRIERDAARVGRGLRSLGVVRDPGPVVRRDYPSPVR